MAMESEHLNLEVSGDIFIEDLSDHDTTDDAVDQRNDETFGSWNDSIKETTTDWEKRHAEISPLISIDAKRFRDANDVYSPRENLLDKLLGRNTLENHGNDNIIHKLIRGDKFEKRLSTSLPATPIAVPRTPKSRRNPFVIRVEDLEKEVVRDRSRDRSKSLQIQTPLSGDRSRDRSKSLQILTPPPTIIKRRPNSSNRHAPFPITSPKDLHIQQLFNGVHHSPRMPPPPPPFSMGLSGVNQRLNYGNYPPLMERGVLLSPPIVRPYLNPVVFGKTAFYQQLNQQQQMQQLQQLQKQQQHQKRTPSQNQDSRIRQQKNNWPKILHPEKFKDIDYEEHIEMEPSKMMNVKEKKWIFKIGLMSLLDGDPYANDYYFISLFTKKMLDESVDGNPEDQNIRKNLEKTNHLVNHGQQTKEGHKPVKFKGSLGKLSITSVHHPRKVMDVPAPEHESKHSHPVDESDQRKLVTYRIVEKMYSLLLSIIDMDRENEKSKEKDRAEKITELFEMFHVENKDSTDSKNDSNLFADLMSIYKGRKLFIRLFPMFSQERCELLFISLISILPELIRTDTEQCLIQFKEKLSKMLTTSNDDFKAKCIELLRKIDVNTLLGYSSSILILSTVLDSLDKKKASVDLNCLYYMENVPQILPTITGDDMSHLKPQLTDLMVVLGLIKSHDENSTC